MVNSQFDKQCNAVKALVLEQNKETHTEDAIKQAVILCILENVPIELKTSRREDCIYFNPDDIVGFVRYKK